MSERYQFNSEDEALLKAAESLLNKIAVAESTTSAERASIAKLQDVLSRLPEVTPAVHVAVSLASTRSDSEGVETTHYWTVEVEGERLAISSTEFFNQPRADSDSFSGMQWAAIPEQNTEFHNYSESHWTVPDVHSFSEFVASVDLNSQDFTLEVSDGDNAPRLERSERELEEKRFNERALKLLYDGRLDEAQSVLEDALRKMPTGWKPVQQTADFDHIAFWDQDEFLAHSRHVTSLGPLEKSIAWVPGSYSHAWHILGVVASKQGQFERALFCLDCGLELEPDHPEHWSEKGFVLGKLKRHEEALQCYIRASTVRAWASRRQIARAMRGQGVQLVDLKRLDEAESALRRSLEFEPDNQLALEELKYVQQVRDEQAEKKKQLPWFIRALLEPPTDPLTVQLMALVEGLPSIPGPKTVGPDNYSKIFDAFMQRGWPGFEEEFDRIVPRDRPDYEQVKRDILCEPIFSAEAHRNTSRAFMASTGASDETLEDVMNDIFKNRDERKPQ